MSVSMMSAAMRTWSDRTFFVAKLQAMLICRSNDEVLTQRGALPMSVRKATERTGSATSPEGRDKIKPAGHTDEQRACAQCHSCEAFPTRMVSAGGADQFQSAKERQHNHLVAQ